MSANARSAARPGRLVVMSGPSGSGKTTIKERLRRHPAVRVAITVTTRKPREGEQDGRDYPFVSREEFLRRQKAGEFAETKKRGSVRSADVKPDYISHLLSYIDCGSLAPLKIVVNAGNGGAGPIIDLLEPHLPFENGGIVHERVHASEVAIARFEQPYDVRLVGNVGGHGNRAPPGGPDVGDDAARRVFVRAVIDADVVAARCGDSRGGRPDAAAATRHEQNHLITLTVR